jgi:hypothetical protein
MSTGWASERLSGVRRRSVSREGGAMRYLCPIYDDETRLAASPRRRRAPSWASMSPSGRRRKSGHYLGREALDSVQTATTVRVRRHKVSTTDGPFAENEGAAGRLLISGIRTRRSGSPLESRRRAREAWRSGRAGSSPRRRSPRARAGRSVREALGPLGDDRARRGGVLTQTYDAYTSKGNCRADGARQGQLTAWATNVASAWHREVEKHFRSHRAEQEELSQRMAADPAAAVISESMESRHTCHSLRFDPWRQIYVVTNNER